MKSKCYHRNQNQPKKREKLLQYSTTAQGSPTYPVCEPWAVVIFQPSFYSSSAGPSSSSIATQKPTALLL